MNPDWIVRFLQLGSIVLIVMGLLAAQDGEVKVLAGIGIGIVALIEYQLCQAFWNTKFTNHPEDERG